MKDGGATERDTARVYEGRRTDERLSPRPTILDHIAFQGRTAPTEPFLTSAEDDGGPRTLSYGELDAFTRRSAEWLRREHGTRAGDVVALAPTNDIASVVAILGALRAGCALLLLNPADPPLRWRAQTTALGASIVLRSTAVDHDVPFPTTAVPEPTTLEDRGRGAAPLPPIDPEGDALFFGTSGSTATSKLVAQSHYNGAVNAEAIRRHHGLRRGGRLLGCLPIHHVNGLHLTLFATIASGSQAILARRFDPFEYPRLIERFRPHLASVVPTILETLNETWRSPVVPDGFAGFISAAAPLSARTARTVHAKLGVRVLQGYGLSETTNFATSMPHGLPDELYARLAEDTEIPSIGVALFGNEVAVLRTDGSPADLREIGEVCMRGHNLMSRYAGNAEATAEAFRGGWFHSQDLGYAVEAGDPPQRFFVLTGRTKNIAKVGGESISLEELERALREIPQIRDAACVALPHRFRGDEIVALIVLRAGEVGVDVLGPLRAAVAPNALPRRVVVVDVIPRNPTGKILRPALAEVVAAALRDAPDAPPL